MLLWARMLSLGLASSLAMHKGNCKRSMLSKLLHIVLPETGTQHII
jgi:hypothetical protein